MRPTEKPENTCPTEEEQRIPFEVREALFHRNDCRRQLEEAERLLQKELSKQEGRTFAVEGVPVKVCKVTKGAPRFYLRKVVGPERAAFLREAWIKE